MKNLILLTLILAGLNAFAENSNYYVSYNCPDNYVRVPALEGYTKNDFCVMKYEAKNDGSGNAISQASGTPYVDINRDDSIDKCTSLGEGYDLITNDEWQTIARNIELVPDNWSEGLTGGREQLSRGHSEGYNGYPDPINYALEASSDDTKGCFQTVQDCNKMTWNSQRRTHILSNGEVIWDLAGNVSEWVKDRIDSTCSAYDRFDRTPILIMNMMSTKKCVKSLSNGTTTISRTFSDQFGPSGDYLRWFEFLKIESALFVDPSVLKFSPKDNQLFKHFRGFGFAYIKGSQGTRVYHRGGSWGSASAAGVFAANNLNDLVYTNQTLGFRCVFHP